MRDTSSTRAFLLFGVVLLALALLVGGASAADPTDRTFGADGIAEVEARVSPDEEADQVGGIVDLEPTEGGGTLAAVGSITGRGHFFAAARFDTDGSPDQSFGQDGVTPYISVYHRRGETSGGVLQAEAVTEQRNGDIVLAGYFDNERATAPALVRFRPDGSLDPTFGTGGKVIPRPTSEGKRIRFGEVGGERLHDVAIAADGDIVAVGGNNEEGGQERDRNPTAIVVAYRPDGKIDRAFGSNGRFKVKTPRKNAFTGFTQIEALPSGKLLMSGYVRQQIVLYRVTAKGRPDPSFGGGDGKVAVGAPSSATGYGVIRAPFAVDGRGRIDISGGTFPPERSGLNEEPVVLARFSPEGKRDKSFGKSIYLERAPADTDEPFHRKHVQFFSFEPEALAIDGQGRIVLTGGELAPYSRGQKEAGYEYFSARRFLPDGLRDKDFGDGGVFATNPTGSQSYARAAVTEGSGKVVAGGWIQVERGGGTGPGNTAMLLTRYR